MPEKKLIIVESPGKIKKIKSFLDSSYEVIASYGHIIDLPPRKFSVNIKNDFEPTYAVISGKEEVIKKIKEKAKKADIVYIMTDMDREGSGIAKHIVDLLPKGTIYKRAITNSITKNAILSAIENAGDINTDMVNSYECRRILDRICGYRSSYLITQATGGKSAGRVQSVTLRILAEREKEIQNFIPQEYWVIDALLEKENGEQIKVFLKKPNKLKVKSKKQADEICEILKKEIIKVSKYEVKETETKAYAPFTTSSLYQSGAAILGWSSEKTASIAQLLYQTGEITYIRTDSVFIIPEFIQDLRSRIPVKYGSEYLPQKQNYFSNKKIAQEAHEAIRVTDINYLSTSSDEKTGLYNIIWKRTVASQVTNMRQKKGIVEFTCNKYLLDASGSKIIFDGWRKVWNYGTFADIELPEFQIGENMKLINLKAEKKITQPPARYTEKSIIKTLEDKGIGRPSTYAGIIPLLLKRKYIEKKKKTICVKEIGIKVSDFLIESEFCFVNINFTKELEEKLDRIAQSDLDKVTVLKDFWKRLKQDIENGKKKKYEMSKTGYFCPKCGGELLLKHSYFGDFFSCENYNNKENSCDYTANIDKETGKPIVIQKEKKEKKYSNEFKCKNCNGWLVIRINKKGNQYLGCENFNKDPKCKGFYDATTGEKIKFKKKKIESKFDE